MLVSFVLEKGEVGIMSTCVNDEREVDQRKVMIKRVAAVRKVVKSLPSHHTHTRTHTHTFSPSLPLSIYIHMSML
jgi:hypothetical protein